MTYFSNNKKNIIEYEISSLPYSGYQYYIDVPMHTTGIIINITVTAKFNNNPIIYLYFESENINYIRDKISCTIINHHDTNTYFIANVSVSAQSASDTPYLRPKESITFQSSGIYNPYVQYRSEYCGKTLDIRD